jgi:hypothetical protein
VVAKDGENILFRRVSFSNNKELILLSDNLDEVPIQVSESNLQIY